ncbi:PRC-barrel domain-containing protein [Actinoplanes sp. NPDC051851]|uniref:PRC-barrel domain-containing protein n=1 Tax=Actinoplanes sp. NPDC051851 TaxID=3154753 RepID=UPI0034392D00
MATEKVQDLGEPVAYLVLRDGTPVYDEGGSPVGTVEHVLADEREDVFHGLLVGTAAGHRFARPGQVTGIFEHGVIIGVPAGELAEPSADPPSRLLEDRAGALRRAWDWLSRPR